MSEIVLTQSRKEKQEPGQRPFCAVKVKNKIGRDVQDIQDEGQGQTVETLNCAARVETLNRFKPQIIEQLSEVKDFIINTRTSIDHDCRIADGVHIKNPPSIDMTNSWGGAMVHLKIIRVDLPLW